MGGVIQVLLGKDATRSDSGRDEMLVLSVLGAAVPWGDLGSRPGEAVVQCGSTCRACWCAQCFVQWNLQHRHARNNRDLSNMQMLRFSGREVWAEIQHS